jgi:carbonic anhydrase
MRNSFFVPQVSGSISNTGHSVMFTVDNSTRHHINVTGGPLSYKYQFQEIHVHYGIQDDRGSEHSINGYSFPAEVCSSKHTAFSYLSKTKRLDRLWDSPSVIFRGF